MEKTVFEKKKPAKKEPIITYVQVIVELLNVRKEASLESDVIKTVSKDAKLKLEGDIENDFYPITLQNGDHGWVKKDFVKIVKE